MAVEDRPAVGQIEEGDPAWYTLRYEREQLSQTEAWVLSRITRDGSAILRQAGALPGIRTVSKVLSEFAAAIGIEN